MLSETTSAFEAEVRARLGTIHHSAAEGKFDAAVALLSDAIVAGGIIHAFGTGHSEAFAMEMAGRAGGLIPTNKVALRDAALWGDRRIDELVGETPLERDESAAEAVFATIARHPADCFVIASNSGVNAAVVGFAILAKAQGHPVIAVTSFEHTAAVSSQHSSGLRLSEVVDITLDNRAPRGDAAVALDASGDSPRVGAVSSITGAFIAQLLTLGTAERLRGAGVEPPIYLSANVPGGDEHNRRLEARYGARIRRVA